MSWNWSVISRMSGTQKNAQRIGVLKIRVFGTAHVVMWFQNLFYFDAITVLQKKVGADPKNDWRAAGSERKTGVLLSSASMRMHFEDKWKWVRALVLCLLSFTYSGDFADWKCLTIRIRVMNADVIQTVGWLYYISWCFKISI